MRAHPLVLMALVIALGCAHGSQRELACQRGYAPSCKRLILEHALEQIERHPWVWECLAKADPDLGVVELTRTLQAPVLDSRGSATATLEPRSVSDPELRECLAGAMTTTVLGISAWGYAVRVDYRARLDPDHVARMSAAAARHDRKAVRVVEREFDGPQPSSCAPETSPDCVVVPSQARLDVIYAPAFDVNALLAAWSDDMPRQLRVSIQLCFDLEGRLTHAAAIGDDPYPAISAVLTDKLRFWRIRPWVVDDRQVEFCTVRSYDIGLWWYL